MIDYHEYIKSSEWKNKREERLIIDGYKCVICKSEENLSVHHLHYENLGNENAQHDLLTACDTCHRHFDNIERINRYKKRQHKVEITQQPIPERDSKQYGATKSELSVDIRRSDDLTQRTNSFPIKQVVAFDQEDLVKEKESRSRLRRNG